MRKGLLQAVADATLAAANDARGDQTIEDRMFASVVERFGPSCAAWLVWQRRHVPSAGVRRGRWLQWHIAADKHPPPWFRIAWACLEQRNGWQVYRTGGALVGLLDRAGALEKAVRRHAVAPYEAFAAAMAQRELERVGTLIEQVRGRAEPTSYRARWIGRDRAS